MAETEFLVAGPDRGRHDLTPEVWAAALERPVEFTAALKDFLAAL
ncbi:hypothetical protein [Streptosporangium pseudovulgare]|uniref:Uncharacterized protein n=1 Tax=Streptosporangium pseudovulgare TaxID=35765 RepID=A0ABQ2QVL8_9ACTN|nr:hypothetical protein [Streptosporangium pseudovulgare]GGP97554.1 hypothetical protein GCM10010140_29540 [Streptosporangium pseudovulgare]